MDQFDFGRFTEEELARLFYERIGGRSGASEPQLSGQPAQGPMAADKPGSTRRRRSASDYVNSFRAIFKYADVGRPPAIRKTEQAQLRKALNQIVSNSGIEELESYAQSNPGDLGSIIQQAQRLAPGEKARLSQELSGGSISYANLGEVAGLKRYKSELTDVIQSLSPTFMGQRDKEDRINSIKAIKQFTQAEALFNDIDASSKQLLGRGGNRMKAIGETLKAFDSARIETQYAGKPETTGTRGVYDRMDSGTLSLLTTAGNVGAARTLFGRNVGDMPGVSAQDQEFFKGYAKKLKSITAIGALESIVSGGATAEEVASNPKYSSFFRDIDQISRRQESSTLIEQASSYFNYMTTQGMRRGTFRFLAQEVAPAVRTSMLSNNLGIGAALAENLPLLGVAGGLAVGATAIEANKLSAQANLARLTLQPGANFAGSSLLTEPFNFGVAPKDFIQSLRALSLTEAPGTNSTRRFEAGQQAALATGRPTADINQLQNRMAQLGFSQAEQQQFLNYARGGVNGSNQAQAMTLLDFYTGLGIRPSQLQFQQGAGALANNPMLTGLLQPIGGLMGNANTAFTAAMLTGKKPFDVMNNPMVAGQSMLGMFGKGGIFDLGPDITPLIAQQFGVSPQDIARMQAHPELVDQLSSLGAPNIISNNITSAIRGQQATAAGAPIVQRILGLTASGSAEDYLRKYAYGPGGDWRTMAGRDPLTGKLIGNESNTVQSISAALLQSNGNPDALQSALPGVTRDNAASIASGLGLNPQDTQQVVQLLQQIADIESGKQTGVKLAIADTNGTTQRQTVNSPTSSPSSRT